MRIGCGDGSDAIGGNENRVRRRFVGVGLHWPVVGGGPVLASRILVLVEATEDRSLVAQSGLWLSSNAKVGIGGGRGTDDGRWDKTAGSLESGGPGGSRNLRRLRGA